MKQTLLEIVQEVLSSMDSDDVNSIDDTVEATQVSKLVRRCYWDMIKDDLPEHWRLFELEATDSSTPTLMTLPDDILFVQWIKYDTAISTGNDPNYTDVTFVDLKAFLDRMYMMDDSESNIFNFTSTVSGDSLTFMGYNDIHPTEYTTYDDSTIIFNQYDVDEDANLQKNKTLCYGREAPTFTLSDSFTPDLDMEQFPVLVNKVKSLAFFEEKQVAHPIADREERRQRISGQRTKRAVTKRNELDQLPNYGRK